MKKFIVYLIVIILAVSLGFAVFYLVRDNEVISISSASIYKDAGEPFQIDVNHQNKKSYTTITVSTSNASVVSYDKNTNTFHANAGGVARINFRTTNAKFRNLWCDVIVGDGTVESPYYISTPEQLASIGMGVEISENGVGTGVYKGSTLYSEKYEKYSSDKCYKLVANIDAKDINEGYWIPLRAFSGRFDGNGLTISNINIDRDRYVSTFMDKANYDPTLFSQTNVGMFQKIMPTGIVYNLKLNNVYASGIYENFGVIAGENQGTIERVEVKDAYLSIESNVFGGLVGNNITTEEGESDTYIRHIARIDRCSINMTAGKKYVMVDDEQQELIQGMYGVVGGLVGYNQGGTIVYSYAKGEIAFGSDATDEVIYGGIVGNNSFITLTKFAGAYTSKVQGGNLKDCYSDIKTNFDTKSTNSSSRFAGAIAINNDTSSAYYDGDTSKQIVHNYLVGVYYNKDNLNFEQADITKNYKGIAEFKYNTTTIDFADTKMIVYGLSEDEMKLGDNFVSHTTQEIEFDENGVSKGLVTSDVTWLFGSVWAIDNETNDGKPYLNYQLIYIPDDFATAGVPIVLNKTTYLFEKNEIEATPKILSGTDGKISLQVGKTYAIKVSPSGFNFTWYSSNVSIASVNSDGVVTGINEGIVTVTASNKSGITDSITVIVTKPAIIINGCPTEINVTEGKTYTFSGITAEPTTTISYLSLNSNIASVTSSGVVTGVSAGSTFIVVSAGETSKVVKVNVYADTSTKVVTLNLADNGALVSNGSTVSKQYAGSSITGTLGVTSVIYNGSDVKSSVVLTYASSNTNILTINSFSGAYTITGSGEAEVSVSASGNNYVGYASVIYKITTKPVDPDNPNPPVILETLTFSNNSYSLYKGQVFTISYSGTTQKPIFNSEDTSIATVNSNGLVTGVSRGTTRVTGYIRRADGTYSYAYVQVTVLEKVQKTLTISPVSSSVNVGDTVNVFASLNSEYSSDSINWTWNSTTIADVTIVSKNQISVKMKSAGTLTVTATSGIVSASMTITATDPNAYSMYIYNANQLNSIRYHLDKDFILADNIDLSGWNWEPIGTMSSPFKGTLRNNGNYQIRNLSVTGSYTYAGLFGYIQQAKIENIHITNANINGDYVGSIAGCINNSGLSGCTATSSNLQGKLATGGIVGSAINISAISSCRVSGNMYITTVSGSSSASKYVGGIAGRVMSSSITGCRVQMTGKISLGSATYGYAGGIAGYTTGKIQNALVEANISANDSDKDYAGGIAGYTASTIDTAVIRSTTISGYYAGGIGGSINTYNKVSLNFSDYKSGYRKSDLSNYNYSYDVTKVAVKDTTTVKGMEVGGLFGVINSGAIKDSYTMAYLQGSTSKANKGGFASSILSSGLTNVGGIGYAGIVENCYSACKFNSTGSNYSITQTYVHNYNGTKADGNRPAGLCFNYLFDNDLDGNASYTSSGNIFGGDKIDAKKSTSDMKKASTYSDKGFSSSVWNLSSNYATLRIENYF